MAVTDHVDLNQFMEGVKKRNPYQPEFVQAVQEVAEDIFDFIEDKEEYHSAQILRRIAEPDRVVSLLVTFCTFGISGAFCTTCFTEVLALPFVMTTVRI